MDYSQSFWLSYHSKRDRRVAFRKTLVLNRFPADKEFLCDSLEKAAKRSDSISKLLYGYPILERIYFTMSERELASLTRRKGDPSFTEFFVEHDGAYWPQGGCIILHIPGMMRKLSEVPLHSWDRDGKICFAVALLSGFFHELGHAYDGSRRYVDAVFKKRQGLTIPEAPTYAENEKIAENFEQTCFDDFEKTLGDDLLAWIPFADRLLNWEKLGPMFWAARKNC